MSKLLFEEGPHKYTKNKKEYISVTTLIGKYKQKFRRNHWANWKTYCNLLGYKKVYSIIKKNDKEKASTLKLLEDFVHPDDFKAEKKKVLDSWEHERDKSIKRGNKYHNSKEQKSIADGFEINPFTEKETTTMVREKSSEKGVVTALKEDLWQLEDGYYPELLMGHDGIGLAGTADKVFIETVKGIRYVDIDDYKTNKVINEKSKYKRKMKGPVKHMDDCNYNHYRLQISLYAWILEEHGYTIRNTSFTHFNKAYVFDYMKEEITSIISDYEEKMAA